MTREPQPAHRPTGPAPAPTKKKPIRAVVPEPTHGPHTPADPEPASRRAVEERKKLINLEEE